MATTEARPLTPTAAELEVALGEVDAVLAAVPAGDYRERLELLRDELADGAVSEGAADELDRLIELALQSGRLRAIYGPGGEAAATRLYRRLPSGRDLVASASEVNDALGALAGRTLEDVSLTVHGPGAFGLSLAVDGKELTVRLDRSGVRVHSVGV
ncbi:MAG TPA: hypothetical protein VFQ28_08305 [Gaiella sp.]|jgi:hypothetical protein|nr:hypothetical protein [Gaiella sp.]